MSLTVKALGRFTIPGGGTTTTGIARNNKTIVWGELTGDYVANGVPITTADIGLTGTFDVLFLQPVTLIAGTGVGLIEPTTQISAQFSEPDGKIIMQTHVTAGDTTESTASAYVVNFFAVGDSAAAPELT